MDDKKQDSQATPWRPWWKKSAIDLWDKRLLIPSLIVGLVVYAWCSYQIKIHTPPEGFVYEQLEPLTGVYKCCGDEGGRSSNSWVGDVAVRCAYPAYYGGPSYTSCKFKAQLNGHIVTVKRVWYPFNSGRGTVVTELTSNGQIYYNRTGDQIRRQWRSASEGGAQSNALGTFLITYLIVLFIYDRKLKSQGNKK